MFSRRTWVLAVLFLVPLGVYLALGAWALWQSGLFMQTFWIIPGCWLATWLVAVFWERESPAAHEDLPHPAHLTPRDEAGLQIVRRYQEQVDQLNPAQLTEPAFYLQQAQRLSEELARHYHPHAKDPVSELTVPEVLAAVRLAVDDLERWMLESVPGSRLMTIRQWRWLRHAPKWVERIQNGAWAASILINPLNVLRYLTSRVTVGPVSEQLQTEFLAAVYLRFIRQTGFYLVEMNSGRLRGGADHYRRIFGDETPTPENSPGAAELIPKSLSVALVGQVKAGKSSLVNALRGELVAKSDVLPQTRQVARYELQLPETDRTLTLLDTPGYADAGATKEQMADVRRAVQEADVVLLVLDAHAPAHEADLRLVHDLRDWYRTQPEFKPPPLIGCLTHVDLLSPVLEWQPPYDWRAPQTRKAHSIHDAVAHLRQLLGDAAQNVIPLCTDVARGRHDGVTRELLPALMQVLDEGQTAALLRAYHRDLDRGQMQRLFEQLKSGGRALLEMWLTEKAGSPPRPDGS